MLEKQIEQKLKEQIESLGGKAFKFISPGNSGVPDRIILLNGQCYFVELKRPGGKLRPLQESVHQQFEQLGFHVYVISSIEEVKEFIEKIRGGKNG
ncbi:MAG: VRR-NUC domain-containing protein [Defluviitoga tunisiensis]